MDATVIAKRAAEHLRDNGFAVVEALFAREELAEVEMLLDELFLGYEQISTADQDGKRLFARDMALKSTPQEQAEALRADQPEILYAASFDPRLRKTAVFRKAQALARAMSRSSAYSFDHAIFKAPHNQSETDWHQDVALTRLSSLPRWLMPRRFHFWIPLQSVSQENGCMEFIAGSHKGPLLDHQPVERRAGEMGWMATPIDGEQIACPLEAGGLTIHDPRTLHYTGRNKADAFRKAWIVHFSQFGAIELALKRALNRAPRPIVGPAAH